MPGTFPIDIDQDGRLLVRYLATVPWTDDFRAFLLGHIPLLAVTPSWLLRVAFSPPVRRVVTASEAVVHEELESPLDARTIADLNHWFFHQRRGTERQTIPDGLRAILREHAQACAGPRFTHLYRRWLMDEEAALAPSRRRFRRRLPRGAEPSNASSCRTRTIISLPSSLEIVAVAEKLRLRPRTGTTLSAPSTRS